jgi:uncharacterized membrane protein YsdA (DUF1294 family)
MILAAALYLLAVNATSYGLFAWDKQRARGARRRVRESDLLVLAAIGGTVGAYVAQARLRHKTRKEPFRTRLLVVGAVQAAALVGAALVLLWRGV